MFRCCGRLTDHAEMRVGADRVAAWVCNRIERDVDFGQVKGSLLPKIVVVRMGLDLVQELNATGSKVLRLSKTDCSLLRQQPDIPPKLQKRAIVLQDSVRFFHLLVNKRACALLTTPPG